MQFGVLVLILEGWAEKRGTGRGLRRTPQKENQQRDFSKGVHSPQCQLLQKFKSDEENRTIILEIRTRSPLALVSTGRYNRTLNYSCS